MFELFRPFFTLYKPLVIATHLAIAYDFQLDGFQAQGILCELDPDVPDKLGNFGYEDCKWSRKHVHYDIGESASDMD
jgi:hypothetical protein